MGQNFHSPLNDSNKRIYHSLLLDEESIWDCSPLTEEMVNIAEQRLGHKLPNEYIQLLKFKNGSALQVPTYEFQTEKGMEIFSIPMIFGLGGKRSMDSIRSGVVTFNEYLQNTWGYPKKTILICHFGHGAHLLDYSEIESDVEPSIIYVDAEEYPKTRIVRVANNLNDFLVMLNLQESNSY